MSLLLERAVTLPASSFTFCHDRNSRWIFEGKTYTLEKDPTFAVAVILGENKYNPVRIMNIVEKYPADPTITSS